MALQGGPCHASVQESFYYLGPHHPRLQRQQACLREVVLFKSTHQNREMTCGVRRNDLIGQGTTKFDSLTCTVMTTSTVELGCPVSFHPFAHVIMSTNTQEGTGGHEYGECMHFITSGSEA